MTKILYEEYFGGEIKDTINHNLGKLLNRWQYKVLKLLSANKLDVSSVITPSSLEGRLLSKNYKPEVEEDQGSRNMNLLRPSQQDINSFMSEMRQKQFLDKQNTPNFDLEFQIRNLIRFPKLSGPRSFFLELTDKCYLACITCYNEFARSMSKDSISSEETIDILDQMSDFGATFVALTGGETTAADRWYEIAKHANDLGMDIRFYTCGIYPTKKRENILDKLISLSLKEIRITYTGTKKTNNQVRIRKGSNKGTFDEITQTVKDLIGSSQNIKLNFTLSHENISEVEDFVRFFYEISQRYSTPIPINIGPLRAYGSASLQHEFNFTRPTAKDFIYVNKTVGKLRKQLGININVVFDCLEKLDQTEIAQRKGKIKNTPWPYMHQGCGLGRSGMSIGYDGSVQVCGIMGNEMLDNVIKIINEDPRKYKHLGITPNILRSEEFTNIKQNTVEEIWYNSPLLSFFQYFYKKEQCEPCDKYRVQCMGICPGMALKESGDLRKGDAGCPKPYL